MSAVRSDPRGVACRRLRAAAAVALALDLLVAPRASAQGVLTVSDVGLSLKLPPLQKVRLVASDDPTRLRVMRGWLGEKQIELAVTYLPRESVTLPEPGDLVDAVERRFAAQAADRSFEFGGREELTGSFGSLSYAQYATGEFVRASGSKANVFVALAAVVTERGATSVEVVLEGEATEADRTAIRASLAEGLTVAGSPRDPRWSDGDTRRRWDQDVPERVRKDPQKPAVRTAHYVVLTNSSNGELFAKKMEEHCARILEALALHEREGRRLLPLFLFKSKEDYGRFCEAVQVDAGAFPKGDAAKDYYATWAESPNDPVHLREATRQLLRNRCGLAGGGAWFQEGLAEYLATKREERNATALRVVKGKATRLRALIETPALLVGGDSRPNRLLAALLIEFVKESPATKEKFPEFLAKVGAAPRLAVPAIERALRASLGLSIDELDRAFSEWCAQR